MQRVFLFQNEDNELDGIHIDNVGKKILKEHLLTRRTASFEWYPDFDLCSFTGTISTARKPIQKEF